MCAPGCDEALQHRARTHADRLGELRSPRRYINLWPVRLFEGVRCPLVDGQGKPRRPDNIDFFVVRENTEGQIMIQESVYSRRGTDRVMKCAYESRAVARAGTGRSRRCNERRLLAGQLRQAAH